MQKQNRRNLGQTKDITFSWITEIDPDMEQWRSLAEEWLATKKKGKAVALEAMKKFLYDYLHKRNLSKIPAEFLNINYPTESFYDSCLKHFTAIDQVNYRLECVRSFLDWVLEKYFSVEDDNGNKLIPSEYHNPISLDTPDKARHRGRLDESNKNTLPYHYLKQLRTILCPLEAINFQDWKWSQKAMDTRKGGDWFVIERSQIDNDDPDCIWRERKTTKYEQEKKELPEIVYEMWSPVRAVALYIKLLLPLRTYQVRMLDSGESDTFRYEQTKRNESGQWTMNNGLLTEGTEQYPVRRGVFRRFLDPVMRVEMTGFYINTNKTADIDKEEWAKGYEVPWQYEEALYWLSKLRNWQEKYNPIEKPTAWIELENNHIGHVKDKDILRQMGTTCFLFRDASAERENNKTKPIREKGLEPLWYKLLLEFQKQCELHEDFQEGRKLKFVKNKNTTYYSLHSLRVSLITAYALEGGVPMPILSKCIAGHARLVMTLYYTKAGINYVSEKMSEAEQKMAEQEQDSYMRWLKDATYKQLEAYSASNDPASLQAVINAQQSGASFIKDDKGICPKGCLGCETGGTYINDDTSKTSYGVVPGYPEQNCVRCRWFLTGPAFLPGLVHHFNVIGYNISENAERLIRFEEEIEKLENLKFNCEQSNFPFMENEKLIKLEKLHQQEMQKNDKLANDYNATLRLIDRCVTVSKQPKRDGQNQFVAVGTIEDVQVVLEDVPDKLHQIQTVCNGAAIFPETDASKAILQRTQILDLTLAMNGKQPIFFALTPEQQLNAGNAWVQLLRSRAGILKDTVPYMEGRKKLSEIGLENEIEDFVQSIEEQGSLLTIGNNQSTVRTLKLS